MLSMLFKSKKYSLIILGLFSLVCSRTLFALFNDPEGPNLLIVTVMAVILYCISWAVYAHSSQFSDNKRFWLAVCVQIVMVAGLFFLEPMV